jgi:hypothetical protein
LMLFGPVISRSTFQEVFNLFTYNLPISTSSEHNERLVYIGMTCIYDETYRPATDTHHLAL